MGKFVKDNLFLIVLGSWKFKVEGSASREGLQPGSSHAEGLRNTSLLWVLLSTAPAKPHLAPSPPDEKRDIVNSPNSPSNFH